MDKTETEPVVKDEHIVHFPEPYEFDVDENYDYLRQRPDKTTGYILFRAFAQILLNIYNRVVLGYRVRGMENAFALRDKGAVVICNHVHVLDCTFIDCALPHKRMYYCTLQSNFKIPIARHLIRWLGGVPIPVSIHRKHDFWNKMQEALDNGSCVVIYPEAVLYPYYKGIRKFKDGAFKLAADSGSAVLPMRVTFRKPKGLRRLFRKKPCVTINILPPVYAEDSSKQSVELLKIKCAEIMAQVNED